MPPNRPLVADALLLGYRRPAAKWVEALPLGNGSLGAMAFGGIGTDRYQLNHDTLWSGGPRNWNNPGAKEALPEVRRAVAEGRYVDADRLAKKMMGPFTEAYMPLGDLIVTHDHGDVASEYGRALNLAEGDRVGAVPHRERALLAVRVRQPSGASPRHPLDGRRPREACFASRRASRASCATRRRPRATSWS